MKYKYIPDSYSKLDIEAKFNNENEFLCCQEKYRNLFEKQLSKIIDFTKYDNIIKSKEIIVPKIEDSEYNFYHKYSNLHSNYIFLRNNYHVERLTKEEIQQLLSMDELDDKFLDDTIQRVLYEEEDSTYFGIPNDSTNCSSKSVVFEFAYDRKKCTTMEQLNNIESIIKFCFSDINFHIQKMTNVKCSFIVYSAMPDIYKLDNDKKHNNAKHLI